MFQRWLRICWKWSMFWKACNKQNTWECWTCTGCNQQRLVSGSGRTRSWSGDSKNYCLWDFDAGSWHETCHGKICFLAPLLPEQKEHCATVANDSIQTTTNEPDFVPCDFWLFPKLKPPLKGERFQMVDEIQENTTGQAGTADGDSNKGYCRAFWTVEEMLGRLCEVPSYPLWRGLRHHRPVYNISCIFFNTCLYFLYYMALPPFV